MFPQVLLLYGRYSEETSKMESNAIVKQYREVIDVSPDWEDGYFYLGRYFDRIMTTLVDDKEDMTKQGYIVVICVPVYHNIFVFIPLYYSALKLKAFNAFLNNKFKLFQTKRVCRRQF